MDVIGLDATLVGGSHGLRSRTPAKAPVFISQSGLLKADHIDATDVFGLVLEHLGLKSPQADPERRSDVREASLR